MTHTVPMMSHVRGWGHHVSSIAVAAVTHRITWTRADGGERAAETSGTSLEVGEPTRWARPIAWSWPILTWWKRRQDFGGSVQNSAGRRGDFDGFLVQRSPVHAQTFKGLEIIQHDNGAMKIEVFKNHTSSCEEKTANPAPVGLCWSGVRSVQKAIGRPPNCVNQLSSSDCVVSCGRPFI